MVPAFRVTIQELLKMRSDSLKSILEKILKTSHTNILRMLLNESTVGYKMCPYCAILETLSE